jgi:uncharacterized protein (TIGR00255 family)
VLLSMTGFGEARGEKNGLCVTVEVRAVNNRYLKINLRTAEPYYALEAEIDKAVRARVKRGALQVQLQVRRQPRLEDYALNLFAVRSYVEQLRKLESELGGPAGPVSAVLALPGVAAEPAGTNSPALEEWPVVASVLEQALTMLQAMRQEEGRAMAAELAQYVRDLAAALEQVRGRAPQVVTGYRDRLREKLETLLRDLSLETDSAQILREVAVFAERTDVAEEIVRLDSHLAQFSEMLQEPESPGRKLDFLIQEMVREVNTLGSKGNDVEIARQVVEMKGTIEKMRELVQNVE